MIVDWIIRRAKRTPYFHLYHADGSTYMERYWLVPFAGDDKAKGLYVAQWWRQPFVWALQKLGLSIRLHLILTHDLDRAMHDHPWGFVSLVLRGYYVEARPHAADGSPRFVDEESSDAEHSVSALRKAGSLAYRAVTDRHTIIGVSPAGVWTLFITGPKRQTWGFFTPLGKIWWWKYPSVHNDQPITEKAAP